MLAYCSYSYSDEIFGSTGNAAKDGYNWVMTNVLPQQAGLTVGNVIYRYTAEKAVEDDMVVHVQNENARGDGYIFRSSDDWSGLPGNTINKVVPVNNIDISYWGNGSIEIDGTGSVSDPSVIYTYQYDPCFDPQTDPSCAGYIAPVDYTVENVNINDPLDDDMIQDELDRKASLDDADQEDRDQKKMKSEKKIDGQLEKVLGIVNTSLLAAESVAKHNELIMLNYIPQTYYAAIPGGAYEEKISLTDKELPDSKQGLRVGFAHQILHQKMVDLQYGK